MAFEGTLSSPCSQEPSLGDAAPGDQRRARKDVSPRQHRLHSERPVRVRPALSEDFFIFFPHFHPGALPAMKRPSAFSGLRTPAPSPAAHALCSSFWAEVAVA